MGQQYDVQQVCLNGHLITDYARTQPNSRREFCEVCGATTIVDCPNCGHFIRGYLHIDGVLAVSYTEVADICPDCGKPFPWLASKRAVVHEWLETLESPTPEAKEQISEMLDDVFVKNARSDLAAHKIKKLVAGFVDEERTLFLKALKDATASGIKI